MEVCADNQGLVSDQPDLLIMSKFPLLTSWKDNKYWTGFIKGQSTLLRIAVSVPNFPFCAEATVRFDEDGIALLANMKTAIDEMISSNVSVVDLIQKLAAKILEIEDQFCQEGLSSLGSNNPEFFLTIFNELDSIGTEMVEQVSNSFQEISLKYLDPHGRKHIVHFKIPLKYPHAPTQVLADLPLASDEDKWPPKISDAYSKFKSDVNRFVMFWSVTDELDNQARVIDPVQPKRKDIHRRILLNQNVVVNILFNPLCPKVLPEIKFSGPEKSIQELESLLDDNCQEWSEEKSILENLEDMFRCEFLMKADSDAEEEHQEDDINSACVICYAYEFEGSYPETTCECGSVYHEKCLSDLLVNDCSVKAKRFCVDCPVCELELKISKSHKVTW